MEKENELKEVVERVVKANLLLNAVLNDSMDRYEEPCVVDKRKYEGFCRAIKVLERLKEKGKCDFEAADINEPYTLHTIYIDWRVTDDFYLYIDKDNKSEIKELLDCVETIVISDDCAIDWQLSSRIYVPME